MESRGDVTRLLADLCAGKIDARERLMPLVYDELHALADRFMRREKPGHTLQATALIHEAYIKLGGGREVPWESRAHFLRVASRAMRNVLVDHERRKKAQKRGGERDRKPLVDTVQFSENPDHGLVELDEALNRLTAMDEQTAQVVELRFFGGLSVEETGRVLGIAPRSVNREWTLARAWLKREIAGEGSSGDQG